MAFAGAEGPPDPEGTPDKPGPPGPRAGEFESPLAVSFMPIAAVLGRVAAATAGSESGIFLFVKLFRSVYFDFTLTSKACGHSAQYIGPANSPAAARNHSIFVCLFFKHYC